MTGLRVADLAVLIMFFVGSRAGGPSGSCAFAPTPTTSRFPTSGRRASRTGSRSWSPTSWMRTCRTHGGRSAVDRSVGISPSMPRPAQGGADHRYGGLCSSALRVRHRHGGAQRRASLPRRAESQFRNAAGRTSSGCSTRTGCRRCRTRRPERRPPRERRRRAGTRRNGPGAPAASQRAAVADWCNHRTQMTPSATGAGFAEAGRIAP